MRGLWGLVFAALVALQPGAGAAPHISGAPDAICAVPAASSLRQRAVAQRYGEASDSARPMLSRLMREHPAAAENLLLTSDARCDDLAHATRVLADLYRRFGDDVDRLEDIAVAIALVHDSAGPLTRSVNGVRTRSPKAHEIFAFFRDRMKRTGARPTLPPELLAYVVDPNVDTEQMEWAAREYASADDSMSLYHQVPYDRELFRTGRKPAMASHSYTLRNLRTYGGVCADRAFFATNVSKALGVPSVVVRGVRSDVTHAWAAQLDVKTGEWRESGRSGKYKAITGRIISPQTRGELNEDELRMLGGLTRITAGDRLEALALAHVRGRKEIGRYR